MAKIQAAQTDFFFFFHSFFSFQVRLKKSLHWSYFLRKFSSRPFHKAKCQCFSIILTNHLNGFEQLKSTVTESRERLLLLPRTLLDTRKVRKRKKRSRKVTEGTKAAYSKEKRKKKYRDTE